jgi:hypothetical protein
LRSERIEASDPPEATTVEEVLADKKIHLVTPMLRIGLEGKPMNQKKRQGQVLFEGFVKVMSPQASSE